MKIDFHSHRGHGWLYRSRFPDGDVLQTAPVLLAGGILIGSTVNLAVALAQSSSKVLLVDGDLRRPVVHRTFQLISEPGLTVPHPRMLDRRFVLEPLLEVWPEARMPDGPAVAPSSGAVARQGLERKAACVRISCVPRAPRAGLPPRSVARRARLHHHGLLQPG